MFGSYRSSISRLQIVVKSTFLEVTNTLQGVGDRIATKCEGTILGKAGTFLKNVGIDYKEVFTETIENAKAKPLKFVFYTGVACLCTCCAKLNPDEASFRNELLTRQQRLMMLSESIRNPLPVLKLKQIEAYHNEGRLRIFSIGLASFIWLDDNDDRTALYSAQCEYLKPTLLSYPSRIVDVGFCTKWWLLDHYMTDYDINPEEFKN